MPTVPKRRRRVGHPTPRTGLTEFKYFRGGHAAGIGEARWGRIAGFIVRGEHFARAVGDDPALYEADADGRQPASRRPGLGIPVVILAGLLVAVMGFKLGGLFGLLLAAFLIRFVVTRL